MGRIMNRDRFRNAALATIASSAILLQGAICAFGQGAGQGASQPLAGPWTDKTQPPDRRADLVMREMTLEEKLQLLHGLGDRPPQSLDGAVWIPGIPRLGIPDFKMTDGRSGVANIGRRGRYATALPSSLAAGATWDVKLAYEYGALVGKEARDLGYDVLLGGTANLIREPRNGRNFECWSEDPILIGKMLGQELRGTQDQHVVGNINRYVVNDQETGRQVYTSNIDKRSLRETDLLAFEIAIEESNVGTVMCAFNRVNGVYACENPYLLNDILKKAWGYQGWVMSDGGAVRSTVPSAMAGLDQELPDGWHYYFGDSLKAAVQQGIVPISRLNDMVHRILRTGFAAGIYDDPPVLRPVNPFPGAELAQRVAEQGIVLLKNAGGQLPLRASEIKSIAVIGSHADVGVLSGAGSDQVSAAGGNAVPPPGDPDGAVWHRSPPLAAIRAKAPGVKVEFDSGTDPAEAKKLAAGCDVAVVFGSQHTGEGRDVSNLSLPNMQDDVITQVAGANPHTIVILETGGPVTMPWADKVNAIIEAWYPGIRGGEAIANILFGIVNPSGKLPVTFPKSEADLPHPVLPGQARVPGAAEQPFDVDYSEGLKNGYKWFDAQDKEPLFAFGSGLSYTTFAYSQLRASVSGQTVTVAFTLSNAGKVAGAEVAQAYVSLPPTAGEPPKRLVAWEKVPLAAGESKAVTLTIDPLRLSVFNVNRDAWEVPAGDYTILVGGSSRNTPLSETVRIGAGR